MRKIGNVRLAYKDPEFWRHLVRASRISQINAGKDDLSRYVLNKLDRAGLKHGNIVLSFNGQGIENSHYTDLSNAGSDQILFSSRNEDLSTNASACASYTLFCENTRITAVVHVSSRHVLEPSFHKTMLLYAITNLKRMAPLDTISAYLSGWELITGHEFNTLRKRMIDLIRPTLISSTEELISRGVKIKVIDVGDHYNCQVFSPSTGEYKTYLDPAAFVRELMTMDPSNYGKFFIRKFEV
jgi:hypothetical protein